MSIAFSFLIDKTYLFKDIQAEYALAQYVQAIIYYRIGYNIADMANQLFFTYCGITLELTVFILPLTEISKAATFIRILEEK